MVLELLNNVPLSENPLTVAFREASLTNKHSNFLGKLVSSPAALRAEFYSPVTNDKIYNNINLSPSSSSSSSSSSPSATLGTTILSQWKNFPDYRCASSMSRSASTTTVESASTLLPHSENTSALPTRQPALEDAAESCSRIFDEYLDIRENPRKVSTTTGKSFERKILFSFNGGKDCMVILHIVCSMIPITEIRKHFVFFVHEAEDPDKLECCEAILFRDWIMNDVLKVDFRICKGLSLREHMNDLVDEFAIDIALIGTRSSDPAARWQRSCMIRTTKGWPDVLLVSPIFRWSYGLIWEYTLNLDVPRCVLYDRGFTSLGAKNQTIPNQVLRTPDRSCSTMSTASSSCGGDNNNNTNNNVVEDSKSTNNEDTESSSDEIINNVIIQEAFKCHQCEPAWKLKDFSKERENRLSSGTANSSTEKKEA